MEFVTFLFGSGWWVLWHLYLFGSSVPMLFALRRLQRMEPEEGPPGGEAAFVLLVGIAISLLLATVADAAMLGWTLGEIRGAMWGAIIGLAFCTVWTLLLFASAKKIVQPSGDPAKTQRPALLLFAIWHAGIVAANLIALSKIND